MRNGRKTKKNRRGEAGGADLIQFITALMIIAIAAATSAFSLYIGRGALNHEWRKKRALELARNELEYWTALIYEGQNGMGIPPSLSQGTLEYEEILDYRSDEDGDEIKCIIQRKPVELNTILIGSQEAESYHIKINVIWEEPSTDDKQATYPDTVKLHTYMIYSKSISGGTGGGSSGSGTGG